jgi:hypothetical protein
MLFPNSKTMVMLQTTSATNGETVTSQNLDTRGFDVVHIDVIQTTSNNVTNNPSVFRLQEADTTDASNFANVSGFVGDTDWTIPNVGTNTATISSYKLKVDVRHKKRYLRLLISPVTTQSFTAVANLFGGEIVPTNAAAANVSALVEG